MEIILASNSPRRKELLEKNNIKFKVIVSNVDETIDNTLTVYENVKRLASLKALDVFKTNGDRIVLAADTIVVYKNEILGKPKDEADAYRMLRLLSGKTHEVITAVAVISNEQKLVEYEVSTVEFKEISDLEIFDYIKTKEPMDKAGSYAIQGVGSKFVLNYVGEFDNIVGLPMKLVKELLKKQGLEL